MTLRCSYNCIIVGDFAAQALIASILSRAFPEDPIVGEEDASDLRKPSGAELKERIVSLANEALTSELVLGDNKDWGIGPGAQKTDAELLDAIDRGNFEGSSVGRMSLAYPQMCCCLPLRRYVDN